MGEVQKFVVPREMEVTATAPRSIIDMVNNAVMGGADIAVIEKLMDLHERHEKREARRAFDAAIAAAKAEIPVINKNKHVGFDAKDAGKGSIRYDHEDLAEIARTVDPILGKHGLSYRFRIKQADKVTVVCVVSHRDGHFEENELAAGADNTGNKNSIQAIGSTLTYLQRYTLKAALGLAAGKDNDAKNADGEPEKISETQLQELLDIADNLAVDKVKFCRWAKIESLSDVLVADFEKAKQAMRAKQKAAADA